MLRLQSLSLLIGQEHLQSLHSSSMDVLLSRRRNGKWRRGSVEKEEAQFEIEIDRRKAREALKKLDQQLQTLSQPQPQPPLPTKKPPSPPPEPDFDRDFIKRGGREEMPQISDSYLAYTAGALVLLTIFNNIIFNTFIKPSVDGYEKPVKIERLPLSEPD
ncbi:cytochrome b [Rhynchospora pubera]|uniref:Cytochrome b n=1 Tax=Rhynchospora pubera TaxID=906938 RepID=A0AAV8EUG8_9POAL|nr:cytochrome b [Rhynchospora pubera]